jgi:hypothetical protein
MKPAIMALESESKSRLTLNTMLLNLCDVTGAGTPVVYCPTAHDAAVELYDLIDDPGVEAKIINDDPTWIWTFEDWAPWRQKIRELCYAQQNTYKMVFCWLADALTANDEDSCGAYLQRAEMALTSIVAKGMDHKGTNHSNFSSWAIGNPTHRERRLALRDAVLTERDRESSVSIPRDRIAPSLLTRPRSPAIVNRNPPQPRTPPKPPPPPPPPPEPVLPSEDLRAAGRVRLVEVLAHPTNLGLLGLTAQDLNPQLPISRLRSLLATLRQGCGGVS